MAVLSWWSDLSGVGIYYASNVHFFLEEQATPSRTRLSNNRSVMPLDVLGRTCAKLKESACLPWPKGPGNPLNLLRARDWGLQFFPMNEEFPTLEPYLLKAKRRKLGVPKISSLRNWQIMKSPDLVE
ncbi:hypothetical protein J437_LFUL010736 [Ladona fulva]|uniref:Uncharacterized protein n=1 Tax=Ladona fulva TaxID=123851 RepID=A0A8K0KCU9_LADFU|nr:hypothetical protein J437_LFUL010736 [Ladona fulva]